MRPPSTAGADSTRRQYLESIAATALAVGTVSGCLGSPGFESDRAVSALGSLPAHSVARRTRRVGKPKSGDTTELDSEGLVARSDGAAQFDVEAGVDGRDIGKAGKVSASSAVKRETYWTAPEGGDYEIAARYDGTGEFSGSLECPEITDDRALFFATTSLSVLAGEGNAVASVRRVHLDHGDDGSGEMPEAAARELVEFVVSKILSRWFGPLAGLIADDVTNAVLAYGEAVFDVLTGECHTVYFGSAEASEFTVSPSGAGSVGASFTANAGRTYKLQFSPIVGSVLASKTYNTGSRATITSEYALDSLSVSRR